MPKQQNTFLKKHAFGRVHSKIGFYQSLEHDFNVLYVFVEFFGMNRDVVQVYLYKWKIS